MKRIGILGGLGPESTVEYYKTIIATFNRRFPGKGYPEIIVFSADINEAMVLVNSGNLPALTEWVLEKLDHLHKAGAQFAAIASNTPHIIFNRLLPRSPLLLLSIVEATRDVVAARGCKRCGLLGTGSTMKATFYQETLREEGINVIVPDADEQERINHLIFSEIELGIIKESTKQELLAVIRRMTVDHGIDAVILGCTELPLILNSTDGELPFFDTTAIHCARIVDFCLE